MKDQQPEDPIRDSRNEKINKNPELSIWEALIPVIILVGMLTYNVFIYGDSALEGSIQFVLLLGAAIAAIIGFLNHVPFKYMIDEVAQNIKSVSEALLILFMVGGLAGTWIISGIIPTMIYYGLLILNPTIFLVASTIICMIISISTGSSWTTSATVGIALIGIGEALGVPLGMTAGAILSGAYFGDKMSPLSDTTNLAPAIAGAGLFDHVRYMTITTLPSIIIALIVYVILGFNLDVSGKTDVHGILNALETGFTITPWLFLVPLAVILMIVKKTSPLIALLVGTLLGALAALIFQPGLVAMIGGSETLTFRSAYIGLMDVITTNVVIPSPNQTLSGLLSSKGMTGMMPTVFLILCAMAFGGIMDAIGALAAISRSLLKLFHSVFGLFASTALSCVLVNMTAADQYLSIVVPGKMYSKAFKDKDLAPVNLSRTLEDAGTVTAPLVPWNTGGAYQSGVLGVPVVDYLFYAVFNYVSPLMTLLVAAIGYKIKYTVSKKKPVAP